MGLVVFVGVTFCFATVTMLGQKENLQVALLDVWKYTELVVNTTLRTTGMRNETPILCRQSS